MLFPDRVSAGGNWLATRRLVCVLRVRTDLVVSVRRLDGISPRLLLRDSLGGRVEIDPEVLVRHPQLWLRPDAGARKAAADGSLLRGETALRRVSDAWTAKPPAPSSDPPVRSDVHLQFIATGESSTLH